MRYHARPYDPANDDFAMVLRFTSRMVIQQTPYHVCLPGDMAWWRSATPDDSALAHLFLWYCNETLVGWSWRNDTQVDCVIDSCEPMLWQAIVSYYANTYPDIALWAYDKQPQRGAVLATHGFVACADSLNLNSMATQHAPRFSMPEGWQACVLGESDIPSRVMAQRSAFQSTKMTTARYDFVRSHPGYTAQWDMVAKNSSGEVDAFCIVWVDAESRFALFEPVGCRQAHHRKGITRGLISYTLHQLYAAGITQASVMSDGRPHNPAQYLYESCGFTWIDTLRMWHRARS